VKLQVIPQLPRAPAMRVAFDTNGVIDNRGLPQRGDELTCIVRAHAIDDFDAGGQGQF